MDGQFAMARLQVAHRERKGCGGDEHGDEGCQPLPQRPADGDETHGLVAAVILHDVADAVGADPGDDAGHDQRHAEAQCPLEDRHVRATNAEAQPLRIPQPAQPDEMCDRKAKQREFRERRHFRDQHEGEQEAEDRPDRLRHRVEADVTAGTGALTQMIGDRSRDHIERRRGDHGFRERNALHGQGDDGDHDLQHG